MAQPIYSHVYDNGLVLLAEPMRSVESAAFSLLLPSGCCREPVDRAGLATFACEMVLRGAGSRDSRTFVNDLDNLGLERGESVGVSHLSFSGATRAKNLPQALSIYADVVRRPRLPAAQLEAGRLVVLQELQAIEDDPSHKVMVELRRRHYPDPWGRASTGDLAALEAISIDEIEAFVGHHVRPNGTIIAVAGRIDFDEVKQQIGELFADWKPADEPPLQTAGQDTVSSEHIAHESNQTQIGVAYPSLAYDDPQYFQAWGAVGALSGGMSSRLFTEVRERRGLCYSVYASHHTLRDRGSVLCYAGTSADRAQETLDVLIAEILRLAEGIKPHELQRLKARVKSGLIMQQESSAARASSIARDWYLLGRVRTLDEVGGLIDELSFESINAYLAENPPRDFTVVTLGPNRLEVPVGVS